MVKRYARKKTFTRTSTRKKFVRKTRNSAPIRKYIPKASPVELKYIDTDATSTALSTTGQQYLMNGNIQGTSHTTRVGNRLTIKKIELNFGFTAQVGVNIKVMLVIDKQALGSAFSLSQYLNAIGGAFYPWATRNSVNSQRFVTVKSFSLSINPSINSTNIHKNFKKYINCKLPVQYNGGATGTIADIQANSLYLVVCVDNAAAMSYTSRLRFSDD